MSFMQRLLRALIAPPRRHHQHRAAVFCSNTMLHRTPKRLRRVYYWNHRPMCGACYRHYCRNIRVIRWFR